MNKEPHSAKVQRETALAHLAQRPYEKPTAAFTGAIAAPAAKLKGGLFAAIKNFLFKPKSRLALVPRRP